MTVWPRCLDDDKDPSDRFRVELAIHDHSRSFDPGQAIDADLQIESSPGQGARITVFWQA